MHLQKGKSKNKKIPVRFISYEDLGHALIPNTVMRPTKELDGLIAFGFFSIKESYADPNKQVITFVNHKMEVSILKPGEILVVKDVHDFHVFTKEKFDEIFEKERVV